jgi:hypothetical protein
MLLKKSKSNKKDLEFYQLCKDSSNEEKIKNFLMREYYNGFSVKKFLSRKDSQFDNYGLVAGLLAAIENNQDKYIGIILDHVADNILDSQDYNSSMQLVFNCASKFKKMDILKRLDNQFSIVEKSLAETMVLSPDVNYRVKETMYAGLDKEGEIYFASYRLHGDEIKDTLQSYNQKPVIYNLIAPNMQVIEFMFEKEVEPNALLIETGFLTSMIIRMTGGDTEPSKIILNDKCREVIKKSNLINIFLNESKTRSDIKKEIFAALEMIELKEEMPATQPTKKRMKI